MLCQYVGAQDGCCYYFVISTFRRETSEISLPCARMSTNDRTVGKEQQICYRLTESRDGLESDWASAAQLAARRSSTTGKANAQGIDACEGDLD